MSSMFFSGDAIIPGEKNEKKKRKNWQDERSCLAGNIFHFLM